MNSKYVQISAFIIYTLVVYAYILFMLTTLGMPITAVSGMATICCWILICFWSAAHVAAYHLFRMKSVRKLLYSEELVLDCVVTDIRKKSSFAGRIRFLVNETEESVCYAAGARTIIISKDLLHAFTEDEIRGAIAHDLGHLESMDCLIGIAFNQSVHVSRQIYQVCRKFLILFLLYTIILTAFLYVGFGQFNIWRLIVIPLYIFLFPKFELVTKYVREATSRLREYRQDEYAHSLGYGSGLLSYLLKSTLTRCLPGDEHNIAVMTDHVFTFKRIRRLEKLTGLR
jgi:Zn-dependent protease with chaperone function